MCNEMKLHLLILVHAKLVLELHELFLHELLNLEPY